jgi:cytohesin
MWDKNNQTPLHLASISEVPNTMVLLLKFRADVDPQDDDNMTPLHLSLQRPYGFNQDRIISGLQLLLEHGASVHAQNKTGQTALHLASQFRITRIMPLLLKLGVDVDAKDNDNMTPLHFALTKVSIPYIQDVARQCPMAQVLLEHGTSAHMRNKDGQTPLHLASRHRFSGIVELLLKFGAEVDVQDNDNTTPLLLVPKNEIFYPSLKCYKDAKCGETARLLLVHGANVNVRDKNGQTALHLASERHFSTFLALLLKFGADVNAQDDDNMTPLHVALFPLPELQRDQWEVSDDDSQAESDYDSRAESDDIKVEEVEVIQLLLEHGANIHMQNKKGETPFQVAAARGKQKVIQLLSEYMQNDHSI